MRNMTSPLDHFDCIEAFADAGFEPADVDATDIPDRNRYATELAIRDGSDAVLCDGDTTITARFDEDDNLITVTVYERWLYSAQCRLPMTERGIRMAVAAANAAVAS